MLPLASYGWQVTSWKLKKFRFQIEEFENRPYEALIIRKSLNLKSKI